MAAASASASPADVNGLRALPFARALVPRRPSGSGSGIGGTGPCPRRLRRVYALVVAVSWITAKLGVRPATQRSFRALWCVLEVSLPLGH